jgi:hypothetical protein
VACPVNLRWLGESHMYSGLNLMQNPECKPN